MSITILQALQNRSGSMCELCGAAEPLVVHTVSPEKLQSEDHCVYICSTCEDQIAAPDLTDQNHWRCLNDSMWSQVPAVQVLAWRMLTRLRPDGWSSDLMDMMVLDEDTLQWAKNTEEGEVEDKIVHFDSNGAILEAGDSVVLIKDLNVKGANFTAKRGTAVRRISLNKDNPNQIEGRVNDQQIVILTQFVKKSK